MLGERFGRFQVVAPLKKSGTGAVWLARTAGGGPLYAVKILDETRTERSQIASFMDEASIMSQVEHQNVLRVVDFGRERGRYYIATEYLQGHTLAAILSKMEEYRLRLDRGVLALIGARAARGLHAAHAALGPTGLSLGVVHRDVNPDNIFITFDGTVKVIEFGIARANQRFTHTVVGVFKGTAAYMSPEQVHERPVDGRSDVFALGVCLWEMASGQRLFSRNDQFESMRAVVEDPIAPPTGGADPRFDEIVFGCLERRIDERPSAGEVAAELLAYATSRQPAATDESVAVLVQGLFPAEHAAAQDLRDEHGAPAAVARISGDLYSEPPEKRGGAVKSAVDELAGDLKQRAPTVRVRPPSRLGPVLAALAVAVLIAGGAFAMYWYWTHAP